MKDAFKRYSPLMSIVLKDEYDPRDLIYKASAIALPAKWINPGVREIENQLRTGSCVANAASSGLEMMSTDKRVNLSRMFLYYNIRKDYEHLHLKDAGSYTRDAFKYINKYGIPDESLWPFIEDQVLIEPSTEAYQEAKANTVNKYERLYDKEDIKDAIYNGYAVIFGSDIGRDFHYLEGPLDTQNYKRVSEENFSIGAHAMCIVGYDDILGGFIIENSWGEDWGDKGLMLFEYEEFFADVYDIWTATEITFNNYIEPEPEPEPEPDLDLWQKIYRFLKNLFS